MRHLLLAAAVILAVGACSKAPAPSASTHARATTRSVAPQATVARSLLPPLRIGGVANLPDRGALVAYPKATPIRDTAYTWRPVSVSENHAIAAIVKGELELTAPDGSPIRLRYARHIEHADGNWTWIGSPAGATPGNEAIITFGPTAVFGTIPTQSGDTLRLTTIRGRTWMLETDGAMEARMGMTGADPSGRTDVRMPPRSAAARADAADLQMIRNASARTAAAGSSTPSTANATTANAAPAESTVDLLVGYTPQLAARFGGASGANTRITFLVDVANQAYAASQVNAAIRLVGTLQVDYTEANSNSDALYDLSGQTCTEQSNGSLNCDDKPVPAALQPLVAMRNTVGADAVSLLRNFNSSAQQGCGIAWLVGAGQSSITPADEPWAMSVVSDSNGDGGGAFPSNGSVCRDEALAHEIGHNMGLQHDRDTAADTDGVLQPEEFGVFPYSFGYRGGSASIYTVMAYGASGQHKVRVFSNPNIQCTWSASVPAAPCGIADQSDNARALRQTLPLIAAFRASKVGATVRNSGRDYNGDGKADIFWSNRSAQQADWWYMNGASPAYGGSKSVPTQYHVAGLGDFDGDGLGDVLWEDGATIWLWRREAAGGYSVQFVANHPGNNWQIVGVGDVNGDGKADIFWNNKVLQQADWWVMNGAAWAYAGSKSVPAQYSVRGLADFNGDGRMDVLWDDGNTIWIWQAGATDFAVLFVANHPKNNWAIAGLGDLNADGKADIFWRNPVAQQADWWTMNGASPAYAGSKSVPAQYRVAGIADFDADGRADVLWEDGSTIWLWHAEPTGFAVQFIANYPSGGWTITR
jgi:hypothetical protein